MPQDCDTLQKGRLTLILHPPQQETVRERWRAQGPRRRINSYAARFATGTEKGTITVKIDWLHDWDEAVSMARAARKPILVDVYKDN